MANTFFIRRPHPVSLPNALLNPVAVTKHLTPSIPAIYGFGIEQVLAGAGVGMWVLDPQQKKLLVCHTIKAFFGIDEGHEPSFYELFKLIRYDYRALLLNVLANGCKYEDSFELELPFGNNMKEPLIWLKLTGKVYRDKTDATKTTVMGTLTDITKQHNEQTRKDDCIAMLSHELRAPLTTIKLYVQLVMKQAGNLAADEIISLLQKANSQTTSITRLIDNFLSVSALSNKQLDLYCERFDMIRLLHEVTAEMQLKFPDFKFMMEFESAQYVIADRERIIQVLVNYLSNAVKYSEENSLVTVRCVSANGQLIVAVKDQGIGISTAGQEQLFRRYYRTRVSDARGFGLGLYLVKEIIKQHKGEVWVDSQVGKGSVFYFSLPVN